MSDADDKARRRAIPHDQEWLEDWRCRALAALEESKSPKDLIAEAVEKGYHPAHAVAYAHSRALLTLAIGKV